MAPLTIRIEFSPDGSTMIGATPLERPATRVDIFRVSTPKLARLRMVLSANMSSPTLVTIITVGAELGGRDRLIGALAAVAHFEARRFERLALDRHARHIGDEVDHVAADDGDAALFCRSSAQRLRCSARRSPRGARST